MIVKFWSHTNNILVSSYRVRCLKVIEALSDIGLDISAYKKGDKVDCIILSKRMDRSSYDHAKFLKEKGVKVIFDLCDNYFYLNSISKNKNHVNDICSISDTIVTASDFLKEEISKRFPGKEVIVIDDLIYISSIKRGIKNDIKDWFIYQSFKRKIKSNLSDSKGFIWFGNHGSPGVDGGLLDLEKAIPTLNSMSKKQEIFLTVVSNSKDKFRRVYNKCDFPCFYIEWSPLTFFDVLKLHDFTIIPINFNDFTLAKSNTRLLTSLSLGVPVFCDDLPSYRGISKCVSITDFSETLNISDVCFDNDFSDFNHVKRNFKVIGEWLSVLS